MTIGESASDACERAHPYVPASGTVLCAPDDIPEGGGHGFCFGPEDVHFSYSSYGVAKRSGVCRWLFTISIPVSLERGRVLHLLHEIVMCAHYTAMIHFGDGFCLWALPESTPDPCSEPSREREGHVPSTAIQSAVVLEISKAPVDAPTPIGR